MDGYTLPFLAPIRHTYSAELSKYSNSGPEFMFRFALSRNNYWTASLVATLVTIGIVSGSAKAQTQPVLFPVAPTQISLPSGSVPQFIGDINGDGHPDLA